MNNSPHYIDDLLAGFVSGTLAPDELETLQQLMCSHPELAEDVAELEKTMGLMLNSFQDSIELPPHLRSKIQQAAQLAWIPRISFSPVRSWAIILAGSIAALLVASLGWQNHQLKLALQHQQAMMALLHAPGSQLYVLQSSQVTHPAQGSLLLNLHKQQAVLSLHHLPTAPAGSMYQLWSIIGSEKQPCRDAFTAAEGELIDKFSISPLDFEDLYDPDLSGFMITLESSPQVDQPQGPIILQSI